MLGRPLNINQMYKYFYTNILSYKRTILGGGSTTFQLFIFKDHPNGEQWSFQQDSAPSHKAKTTQRWLTANVPDFISTDAWPSASPDLNPLDYAIWSKLEAKVCCKPHTSVDALKRSLLREWDALSMDTVRKSIEEWRPRLEACIRAKGGYFEDSLY